MVDDGSTDETVERLNDYSSRDQRIRLVSNQAPHCFARACNRGACEARGDLLLFLNNDIEIIEPAWFEPLLAVLQLRSEVGIVAPRLLFPNGTIQHCGKLLSVDSNGLPKTEHYLYEQPAPMTETQQGEAFLTVTGACILVRREQFLRIGPFDEGYENGWEDDDLCLAYREQGLISWVCPESTLLHHQGGTLKAEALVLERYLGLLSSKGITLAADDTLLLGLKQRTAEKAEHFARAYQHNRQLFASKWGPTLQKYLLNEMAAANAATIVIVTYNSAGTILQCLQSVVNALRAGDQLVLVDNHSTDATCRIVETVADSVMLTLIKNKENRGFSAASNQGIRLARTPFVVLLNPDTVVTAGWLERLSAHFVDKKIAAVGPVSNFAAARQSVAVHWRGELPLSITPDHAAELLFGANRGRHEEAKLLIGFCLMISRAVLQKNGGLDERLFLGNDDLELSWRLRLHGYRLVIATDTFVWHEGQHSFKTSPSLTTGRLVQESSDALYRILETHYGPGRVPSPQELWGVDWFRPTNAQYNPVVRSEHTLSLPRAWECPRANGTKPLVSVVILTFNQWACTDECLEAVRRHTPESHEVVIVDNGSTDGTPERLQALAVADDRYTLLLNTENRGYAAGCNQGIQHSCGEYIVLLNNDVVVTPEWLSGLLECHASMNKAGFVGPLTNSASGIQVVPEPDYSQVGGLDGFAQQFRVKHRFRRVPSRRIVGFCMVCRRSLLDEIGLLDEQFITGNYEDDDICLRAAVAGYQNLVAADVFVHHHGSMTFKGNNIDYRSALARNAALFHHKWSKPVHDPILGRKIAVCRTLEQVEQLLLDEQFVQAPVQVRQAVAEHPDDVRLRRLMKWAELSTADSCLALQQVRQLRSRGYEAYAAAYLVKTFVLEPWQPPLQAALLDLACSGQTGLVAYADDALRLYPASRGLARLRIELAALENCSELLVWAESFVAMFGFDERVLHVAMQQRHHVGPYRQDAPAGKSVALCMIVKDEEQYLARCLASCKPVVHEIIVVDTGSSDHTKQIAELFGAKLLSRKWDGDFSTARNESLGLATADWILVMDADEVLSPRDYTRFSQILEYAIQEQAYVMTTRNYTEHSSYEKFVPCQGEYPESEAGAGWTPSDKVRIFPNRRCIRFAGAIHEMVEDSVLQSGIAMVHHPVPVHHYGGLKQTSIRAKQEQYLTLGLKKLAEQPDDRKALYELAIQAAELEQYATAEELWKQLLIRQPDFARGWFNLGYVLLRAGKLQESVAASEKALHIDSGYTDALVNKSICEACLFTGEEAFQCAVQALQCCPDNPALLSITALALYRTGRAADGAEMVRQLKQAGISCTQLISGIHAMMEQTAHTDDLVAVQEALAYSAAV